MVRLGVRVGVDGVRRCIDGDDATATGHTAVVSYMEAACFTYQHKAGSCVSCAPGIYSMMIPGILYALWGSSRHAAIGPQSVPCLLLGSAVAGLRECVLFVTGFSVVIASRSGTLLVCHGVLCLCRSGIMMTVVDWCQLSRVHCIGSVVGRSWRAIGLRSSDDHACGLVVSGDRNVSSRLHRELHLSTRVGGVRVGIGGADHHQHAVGA